LAECVPGKAGSGYKALIVEDDQPVLALLTRIVESYGFTVESCRDVESASEAFFAVEPHLVLMDWLLPDGDGLELSRRLRAGEGGKYLTILMVSGKNIAQDIASAIDAGVNFYMAKPVEADVLGIWLSAACKHIGDSLQRKEDDLRMERFRAELEDTNEQLEEAISRANTMAMDAELAYIEISQIFKTVAGGILLTDKNCNLLRYNDSFLAMAGITREEASGKKCYEVFHSCLCDSPECPLQLIKSGAKRVENEIEKKSDDGSSLFYHIISSPFRGPEGDLIGIVEHITDITERVRAEKALAESERRYKELSTVDELTGLYNKRYLKKHLHSEVERSKRGGHPLCLLLMDIDNFKHHNDTYGHADGDRVLARLGQVIARAVRASDVACRYGGEEFTVILPDTDRETAVVVAERIRNAFAAEAFFPVPEEEVRKTISIGVAQYAQGESEGELLERADQNMYKAKQGGRNRTVS